MLTENQLQLVKYKRNNLLELAYYCAKNKNHEKARYYIRKANESNWLILKDIYILFPHLKGT